MKSDIKTRDVKKINPVGQPPPNMQYIKPFVKEFYSEYLHTTYFDEVREIRARQKNGFSDFREKIHNRV
jgi:hypothetical protein